MEATAISATTSLLPPRALVQLPSDARGPVTDHVAAVHASTHPWAPAAGTGRAELLAAFAATLYRYTQQPELTLDLYLPGASQPHELVLTIDPGEAFAALTARVAGALEACAATAPLPSDRERLGPGSNVAVTFIEGPTLSGGALDARAIAAARPYDLHLCVAPHAALRFAYNREVYRRATVARLAGSFATLHAAARAERGWPVYALPVLEASEIGAMLDRAASGHAEYPAVPAHRLFETWVEQQPDAIAATFKGEAISYAALDERANRLAQHLVACGVAIETPVAVCVQPSLDVLVAFLAIWKAGGVYVPLDPTHPEALVNRILDEAQPALVLTQAAIAPLTERFSQLCFDRDADVLALRPPEAPAVPATLDRAAYLLYTSGTTGKPKGVRASHGNLAHYLQVARQTYGFRRDDVFCSMARYTFSISMFELVSPLVCGGSLRLFERDEVLAPDRLVRNLHDVTVLHAGPSLLGNLFRHLRQSPAAPGAFDHLRHVSSGGDLVPPHVQEQMKEVFPNAELFVIYGCTEVSCMGATFPIPRHQKVSASFVGRAFDDVVVRVLDPQRQLCPVGVVGEICFAGKGVVEGYLDRPELNAEKFVEIDGHRFYTTGDMGRVHADGNLEILGRRDFQIQLRGIRIELAGIENTVRELGLAANCAVVVKKLDEQDTRLIAFVVKPQPEMASIAAFRRALAAQLPDYMLPQGMVVLEALPLTANGKLDRGKLAELPWQDATPADASGKTAPRTGVEQQIAACFARALGVPEPSLGIDDDFFDLGGHSLLAVTVMQEVEDKLGLTLPPGVLFERTTVRKMAELAQSSFTGAEQRPLLLAGNGDKPALFMLLGVHLYRPFAQLLQDRFSVYGVYAGRELVMFEQSGEAPPVAELAREYIEIIRRQQPQGPYRIGGMSFGGIVAYEVVQQLKAAGEEVEYLCMLDSVLPEPGWRGRVALGRRLALLPVRTVYDAVATRIRNRLRVALGGRVRSEFVKYGPESDSRGNAELGALEERRQDAYRRSALAYVSQPGGVRPLTGNVTLVVSGRRVGRDILQDPNCGWIPHVPGLKVRPLDADHIALVEAPMVNQLAELVRSDLVPARPSRPTVPLQLMSPSSSTSLALVEGSP